MTAAASGIVVNGVRVRIRRKHVKTLRIRVAAADGQVEASVPLDMPAAHVADFVRAKMPWIRVQQERLAASPQGTAARASKAEVAAWRTIVEALVPDLVAKWEPVLGVRAGCLAYRNMTSRWGAASRKRGGSASTCVWPSTRLNAWNTWWCTSWPTCASPTTARASTPSSTRLSQTGAPPSASCARDDA